MCIIIIVLIIIIIIFISPPHISILHNDNIIIINKKYQNNLMIIIVNCIRRDKLFKAIKEFIPELLPYIHSACSALSILLWEGDEINSSEGILQGVPIGPLLFCFTIHKLVSSLMSEFSAFYWTMAQWVVILMTSKLI